VKQHITPTPSSQLKRITASIHDGFKVSDRAVCCCNRNGCQRECHCGETSADVSWRWVPARSGRLRTGIEPAQACLHRPGRQRGVSCLSTVPGLRLQWHSRHSLWTETSEEEAAQNESYGWPNSPTHFAARWRAWRISCMTSRTRSNNVSNNLHLVTLKPLNCKDCRKRTLRSFYEVFLHNGYKMLSVNMNF